ncbi:30S ribosomal protein S4 [Candidatus Woesearchaeota archaeon]|nr:30S ribosomal protein S4 [Candidatus Woesearchaeota archaeon]
MGHPKLKKKTYSKPAHPWQKERIEEEKALLKEFGLKNKKEVWRVDSLLRKYAKQAKNLIVLNTPQSELEKSQLIKKLSSLGLIEENAKLEDVLTIKLKDILGRRLQTIVYKNKLSKTIRQARQLITHEHIMIGEKKITSPSYIVRKNEEPMVNFAPGSSLSSEDHPERISAKEQEKKEPKAHKKSRPKKEAAKKERKDKEE